jgi:multidrug efflux pump subunit AcrA (membrane-fusion protein)
MRNVIILLLAGLLYSCGGENPDEATTAASATAEAAVVVPPTYPTETVSLGTYDLPIRLTGRVIPVQEATISSQVPGLVLPTGKLLQEGKFYRKGETMVRLDNEQLLFGLQAERSQLIASLVRILSDLSIDYAAEYPQWESFTNAIKADQFLPALPAIKDGQLNYYVSATGIPAQYYAIKAKESTVDDYTIRAPFSGLLTMAAVDPGSYVSPGMPLAKISRTDVYEVRADLPANAVLQVKVGQKIQFLARNLDRKYTGTVDRFGSAIDPATQTVPVFIRISGPELRSGLYLEADLPGKQLTTVAILPKESLTRDNQVLVIEDGVVIAKGVEVALVESEKVYLRGLADGDRVITVEPQGAIIGSRAR